MMRRHQWLYIYVRLRSRDVGTQCTSRLKPSTWQCVCKPENDDRKRWAVELDADRYD